MAYVLCLIAGIVLGSELTVRAGKRDWLEDLMPRVRTKTACDEPAHSAKT